MSFSIIAPSILAGIPLPVPVEVKEPTDFMKFMVKHFHAAREIDKLNFFLNTQEPGLIFDHVGGGHRRYAGWANSYQSNGRNKLRVHARGIPSYVSNVRDPLFSAIPYPFGVPVVGAPLFGTSGDKFGVQSVVGPGGLIIPVKRSEPIGTDGKPLSPGVIVPLGGPVIGGPVGPFGPVFPGMFGLRISRRETNLQEIENIIKKIKEMHEKLVAAYEKKTPVLPTADSDIANEIEGLKRIYIALKEEKEDKVKGITSDDNIETLLKSVVEHAKKEYETAEKTYNNLSETIKKLKDKTT